MSLESDWPDATAVHAALAPLSTLLAERRALYHLAADLFTPQRQELTEEQLDNPLFRFRIGEALADRAPFDPAIDDRLDDITTELRSGPMRLSVAASRDSNDRLAQAMRLVHAQSGVPGPPPRLLTQADGEAFQQALDIAEAGLNKAREVSPRLADDLLPHSRLLVILDPATSGGLVSASSRLFPGLILLDPPSCPYDVAEALIHEGAHQKFFDLAITHAFLAEDIGQDRIFRPSWSGARWPVEQVVAAFHAYACLAQFAEDVARRGENSDLGKDSLLPEAREREREIGRWLLDAEQALEIDARWLLRTFLREDVAPVRPETTVSPVPNGDYVLDPLVRMARTAGTGRVLLARPGNPPELHWLEGEAIQVVERIGSKPLSAAELGPEQVAALAGLVASALAHRIPDKRPS
jgi:hypothetical protein